MNNRKKVAVELVKIAKELTSIENKQLTNKIKMLKDKHKDNKELLKLSLFSLALKCIPHSQNQMIVREEINKL